MKGDIFMLMLLFATVVMFIFAGYVFAYGIKSWYKFNNWRDDEEE